MEIQGKESKPLPVLVRVVDVDISFGQMVLLLIKLALASIPAAILLFLLGLSIAAVFGVFGHLGR